MTTSSTTKRQHRQGSRSHIGLGSSLAIAAAVMGAFALFFQSLPEPEPRYEGDFVVGPVTVFQEGRFSEAPLYVTVDDGVITAISADKPDLDVPFVTAEGGTLLPGLTDAHMHTFDNALGQQLRAGVTSVLDMFMPADLLKNQLEAQRQPKTIAREAHVISAGVLATAPKGHGTEYGIAIPTITSPEQADAFVRERIAEGSTYLKIVYQSTKALFKHKPSIDQATLKALVDAAHHHGIKAVVHIADQVSALDAVTAGADGLVHSFFDSPIKAELLQALVQRQVFVIPTLTVYDANIGGTLNQRFQALLSQARPLTPREHKALAPRQINRLMPPNVVPQLYANVRAMHDAGVVLLAGTDAPNSGTLHGLSLQTELLALREVGLSDEQALLAASRAPLRQIGITDRGEIAIGQQADLVLLGPGDLWQQLTKPLRIWHQGLPVTLQPPQNPALSAGPLVDFSEQTPGIIDTEPNNTDVAAGSVQTRQGFASVQTDARFGGHSTAQARIIATTEHQEAATQANAPLSNPVLDLTTVIEGSRNTGWAGFSWVPFAQFNHAADLSAASHLHFRIKGDPGTYKLLVISGDELLPTRIDIVVTAAWQQITLDLANQPSIDVSAIKVLQWTAPTGTYHWQLDDIGLRERQ